MYRTYFNYRRTSVEARIPTVRSASSESSTGSESSGSAVRSTGASFTTEEMKQKYLARTPSNPTTAVHINAQNSGNRDTSSSSTRPFQSRFLGIVISFLWC